jgi:hypothetical protein
MRAVPLMTRRDRAKTTVQEATFVTTGDGISKHPTLFCSWYPTEVANDASDVMTTKNIALVQHYQRNGKTQAQMGVDEIYLR